MRSEGAVKLGNRLRFISGTEPSNYQKKKKRKKKYEIKLFPISKSIKLYKYFST